MKGHCAWFRTEYGDDTQIAKNWRNSNLKNKVITFRKYYVIS